MVSELDQYYRDFGIEGLQRELLETDPVYYHQVDLSNPMRLIRALSVCRVSGKPFSSFQNQEKKPRPFLPVYILLELERAVLYRRIEKRVDEMIEKDLSQRFQELLNQYREERRQYDGRIHELESLMSRYPDQSAEVQDTINLIQESLGLVTKDISLSEIDKKIEYYRGRFGEDVS